MPDEFHETIMGHRFFEAQLPSIMLSLERIADALTSGPKADLERVFQAQKFFRELMDGNWDPYGDICSPGTKQYQTKKERVLALEDQISGLIGSENYALLDQYGEALLARLPDQLENAFLVGYQTAVRFFLMGITPIQSQLTPKKEE